MKSAIFLVTTLTDVKQDGFSAKLRALLEQQVPVQILFADLNFLERTTFDQLLAPLVATNPALVTVTDLFDIFSHEQGSPLSERTRMQVDHTNLTVRRHTSATGTVVRYLHDDQLLEEAHFTADQQLNYQNFYQDNLLTQVVFWGKQRCPVTISNFQAEVLKETLLLNAQGELVYRFMREEQPVQKISNGKNAAKLQVTDLETPQSEALPSKKSRESSGALTVHNEQTTIFKVMDYVDATDFNDIHDFYCYALQRLDAADSRLYVAVSQNVEMSAVLPDQLIFNY